MKRKIILCFVGLFCLFGLVGCADNQKNDSEYEVNFSRIILYCEDYARLLNGKYKLSWDESISSNLPPSSFDLSISPNKEIVFIETFSTGGGNDYYNIYTTISFTYGDVVNNTMVFNAKWKIYHYDYGVSTSLEAIDSKAKLEIQNGSFVVRCTPETNTASLDNESFSNLIWSSFQRLQNYFINTISVNLFEE